LVNPSAPTTADAVVLLALVSGGPTGTVSFTDGATVLGTAPVQSGVATLTVTGLSAGAHSLGASFTGSGIYQNSTATTVTVTITDAPATSAETIATTIPAGTLLMTVVTTPVNLGTAALDPGATVFVAGPVAMPPVTITDTRAGNPGWNVHGQTSDFTGTASGNRINGQNLGWRPGPAAGSPSMIPLTYGPEVPPALGVSSGDPGQLGLRSTSLLAMTAPGTGLGTAVLSADLTLTAPTTTRPETYTGVLTLTAI
jgi:hypothetical protein